MKLTLRRFSDHPIMGTLGEIWLDDQLICYTIEQPWNHNLPYQSCVPAGAYELKPWSSTKHPNSYVLINEDLNVFEHENPHDPTSRFACLIHVANWAHNVQGCIGPGLSLGYGEDSLMVKNSSAATHRLLALIKEKGITQLHIEWGCNRDVIS